jgi:hypothetical protein
MASTALNKLRPHRNFVAAIGALSALVVGGGFAGNLPSYAAADAARRAAGQVQDRCAGGTEVSGFVCRNTWLAFTKR